MPVDTVGVIGVAPWIPAPAGITERGGGPACRGERGSSGAPPVRNRGWSRPAMVRGWSGAWRPVRRRATPSPEALRRNSLQKPSLPAPVTPPPHTGMMIGSRIGAVPAPAMSSTSSPDPRLPGGSPVQGEQPTGGAPGGSSQGGGQRSGGKGWGGWSGLSTYLLALGDLLGLVALGGPSLIPSLAQSGAGSGSVDVCWSPLLSGSGVGVVRLRSRGGPDPGSRCGGGLCFP